MTTDCGGCEMRGIGCPDCVVAVIESQRVTSCIGEAEMRALRVLADAGLVRLRPSSASIGAPTWTSAVFPDAKAS